MTGQDNDHPFLNCNRLHHRLSQHKECKGIIVAVNPADPVDASMQAAATLWSCIVHVVLVKTVNESLKPLGTLK